MPTLDYQNPETPGGALTSGVTGDLLLESLRTESLRTSGGGMLFLLGGMLITMFMMVFPATLIAYFVGGYFWIIYILCLALLVPMFVMRLRRDSGHVFESTAMDIGSSSPSSVGEYDLMQSRLSIAIFVDSLMFGPRLMIEGIEMAQGVQPVARQARLVRAAELLRQLAAVNEAISVSKLRLPNETLMQLDKVVVYLDRYDWIGASSDRRRVWLSSKAQAELPKFGIRIGTIS